MSLPKKLSKNAPEKKKKAVMKKTMHELKTAPVEAPSRKATHGKHREKQDIAIALKQSGQSHEAKSGKKMMDGPSMTAEKNAKKSGNRRKRNIGRS